MSKFDVLVPFHRIDGYFYQAVESISQILGDGQIIFIDDRIDRSLESDLLFRKFPKKYKIIETSGGLGYGAALRAGTSASEAEFIALFNSDDLVAPTKFMRQIETIEDSDISITGIRRLSDKGKKIKSLTGSFRGSTYDHILLLFGAYGANASWLMKREWWEKNSFFDNKEVLDWRIALRSFDKAKISYIPDELYYYRKHPSQITFKKNLSPDELSPAYQEWKHFCERMGIGSFDFLTFSFSGVPWNVNKYPLPAEIRKFLRQVRSRISKSPAKFQGQVENLISRRFLLHLQQKSSIQDVVKSTYLGRSEIGHLSLDVIHNFMVNHF
jgi:glycosyltransferase involved in cell wall biosynthesis